MGSFRWQTDSSTISVNAFADSVHKRALTKRQDASTSYLPSIIAAATPACLPGCQDIPKVIAQCSATAASEEETGRCACGQTTLGIIRESVVPDPGNRGVTSNQFKELPYLLGAL